jgi:hypothetical protein
LFTVVAGGGLETNESGIFGGEDEEGDDGEESALEDECSDQGAAS